MKPWLRQHGYALEEAWRHIRRPRGGFLLNVAVIAIALMLPFAGYALLENLRPVSEQLAVKPQISVFLTMNTSRQRAADLAGTIGRVLRDAQAPGELAFITREQALTTLQAKSAAATSVASLGINPLPDAYVITLAPVQHVDQATRLDAVAARLKALPGVEHVQIDSAWLKRLAAVTRILQLGLGMLAAILALVVVSVVFNTIRLQVLNQRDEIAVCTLVGATRGFIYRPFYYAGAFLGLLAGVVALSLVAMAFWPLNRAVADLAGLYGSLFQLAPLQPAAAAIMLVCSASLGLLGALLSVRRSVAHLH